MERIESLIGTLSNNINYLEGRVENSLGHIISLNCEWEGNLLHEAFLKSYDKQKIEVVKVCHWSNWSDARIYRDAVENGTKVFNTRVEAEKALETIIECVRNGTYDKSVLVHYDAKVISTRI